MKDLSQTAGFELLADEVELYPFNDKGFLYDVFIKKDNKETFYAQNRKTTEILIYKLDKPFGQIQKENRTAILDYCLGKNNYDQDEQVTLKDVFMQNEFVSLK